MKFSIVTPSFNQGKWIGACLASVEKQTGETLKSRNPEMLKVEVEHWVMDGGSSDETVVVLRKWKEAHLGQEDYFFDFISERDGGQSQAINKGLARATGEIFSYLCSDDLLEPGTLAAVAAVFSNYPEVDVVYGDYFFLEGDSGWKRLKKAAPFSLEGLQRHNFLSQPATFWRRRVYERFGGFDENLRFCMDHEYWLRIAGEVQWHYLEQPLASMRLHADAKTSASLGAAWRETYQMVQRYGLGRHFFWKTIWMNVGGQWVYRCKRVILRMIGSGRRKHD